MRISEYQRSWIVGTILIVILATAGLTLSANNTLQRLDLLIYDLILPLQAPEMSDDIVIVAIDDVSINKYGRWPWSRQRHADLLDKLSSMSPRAIGIDLLFSESEKSAGADQALAQAMANNKRTVLVVAPIKETEQSPISELLPLPILASAAAAIGHVDIELDIDGLNRHFYIHGGIANAHWPSIALAMLKVGNDKHAVRSDFNQHSSIPHEGTGWIRSHKIFTLFSSPDDQAKHISYADILTGRISSTDIQDKYILIGATSSGIGDAILTPTSHSHQRMAGVDVIAQELNTLLQDQLLYQLAPQIQHGLTLILVTLCVAIILLTPHRFALITTLLAVLFIICCSMIMLVCVKLWFSPAPAMLMVIIAWPLWSIRQNRISERLTHHLQTKLEEQSRHHILTGLPNHGMLQEWLYKLKLFDHSDNISALFIIHITKPESAVSTLSRSFGDSILHTISERLKTALNTQSFIAHLNDDDFAILITEQKDINAVHNSAQQLLAHLQSPLNYLGEDIVLSPNIGISIWPTDSRDSADLMRKAYTAMFKSRMDINQPICIYSADIGQEIEARAELERAMAGALERNEFKVYYQPQVDANTGKLIGAEALLRWHSSELGWVGPDTFVPVAEQSGLINSIGDWVLKTACNDLKTIKKAGLDPIRIGVNLSPLQFSDTNLADNIAVTLLNADIAPAMLELEVTESTLMNNINSAVHAMVQIKNHGMSLAIDDFGTGYSSLKHLQNFPLDRLKIDKCFTQELDNKSTSEITLSIIELAKRLNLSVIAEGVETIEQANFLRDNGCDEFQGYLYSKAIPAEELVELMKIGKMNSV
jgi:diguanylate cyclase (GGDEF)-like protein